MLGVPAYAALALVAAVLALSGFVLSQNVALVRDTVIGGRLPLGSRATILVEQYPFVGTGYEPLAGVMLVVVALLTGVNLAVASYHLLENGIVGEGGVTGDGDTDATAAGPGANTRSGTAGNAVGSASSLVGVLLGALGAGCAACGSAVLVGALSLVGASGALLFLPLDGLEFTLIALAPLLLSSFWLADGMRGAEIRGCPVEL